MRKTSNQTKRGFTLLELIIVIAILAILAVTVIIIINPAETLKRARDSQRLSDLAAVKTALGLYLTDTTSNLGGTATTAYVDLSTVTDNVICGSTLATKSSSGATDGTGWIPVNLNSISTGSPIGVFPLDPTNKVAVPATVADTDNLYIYRTNATTGFEIDTNLESALYTNGGTQDKESTDGGDSNTLYETGTSLTLCTGNW